MMRHPAMLRHLIEARLIGAFPDLLGMGGLVDAPSWGTPDKSGKAPINGASNEL